MRVGCSPDDDGDVCPVESGTIAAKAIAMQAVLIVASASGDHGSEGGCPITRGVRRGQEVDGEVVKGREDTGVSPCEHAHHHTDNTHQQKELIHHDWPPHTTMIDVCAVSQSLGAGTTQGHISNNGHASRQQWHKHVSL